MNKPEVERHANAMADAIGEALRRLRPEWMRCLGCGEIAGKPHSESCIAAPIIRARAAYRMAEEADSDLPPAA